MLSILLLAFSRRSIDKMVRNSKQIDSIGRAKTEGGLGRVFHRAINPVLLRFFTLPLLSRQ